MSEYLSEYPKHFAWRQTWRKSPNSWRSPKAKFSSIHTKEHLKGLKAGMYWNLNSSVHYTWYHSWFSNCWYFTHSRVGQFTKSPLGLGNWVPNVWVCAWPFPKYPDSVQMRLLLLINGKFDDFETKCHIFLGAIWKSIQKIKLEKKPVFHSTMLQKLSKCEVKAWLCWSLIILPSLRFYVKSNFGKFKLSKIVIFGSFRDSKL